MNMIRGRDEHNIACLNLLLDEVLINKGVLHAPYTRETLKSQQPKAYKQLPHYRDSHVPHLLDYQRSRILYRDSHPT